MDSINYIKNYFDKDQIDDVTSKDIENYFNTEKEESDKIEYKSSTEDNNIQKIFQTICGFLNSDGGVLVWGAPKGQKVEGRKEKVFIGELTPFETLHEKDQFIRKVTDSITPSPSTIKFKKIEVLNKFIYLIEVNKSQYSPHQYDGRFYMRIDGQTKVAPYHFIEAMFKKITFPNLAAYLKINDFYQIENKCRFKFEIGFFNLSKLQNDYNLYYRINCNEGIFDPQKNILMPKSNTNYYHRDHEKIVKNIIDVIHYGEPIVTSELIEFEFEKFQFLSGQFRVIIMFGAKNSPLKTCDYTIQIPNNSNRDFKTWFLSKRENKFMHEISDKSDEDKISGFLNYK